MRYQAFTLSLLAATLAGCAQTTPPQDTALALPDAWQTPAGARGNASVLDDRWWQLFGSAELNRLVEQALQGSPDLAQAVARVQQAQASADSAAGSLFPSVSLSGSSSQRETETAAGASSSSKSSSLSAGLSYEVDLWGKLAASQRAAAANLQGSRYDLATARQTLVVAVVNAYCQLQAVRERLALAQANLRDSRQLLDISEARLRHGAATELDVSQVRSSWLTQQATVLSLQNQQQPLLNTLAILAGQLPQGFNVASEPLLGLNVPEVPAGLPSEVLRRRPDIAKAESELAAAAANLDAARAALYPSLQLSGSAGLASTALLSLSGATQTLSLGASLAQTLFDGGKLRAQVASSQAARQQLLYGYRKSALTALGEVEDALNAVALARQQERLQQQSSREAERTLQLTRIRQQQGLVDMATLLAAQKSHASSRDSLLQQRLALQQAVVTLIKALGGGWQPDSTV